MLVSIHQPHFFPWYGYINKIASSDVFIVLDECQFTKGSKMNRQTLLCNNKQLKYITVPVEKKDILEKKYNEIIISSDSWKDSCKNFIINNYCKYPFFDEVWNEINYIFDLDYKFVSEI
ncbi:MAG: WbqC family protein, partial [Erysipelotrichales bacterium]|nr:WbqC family protein [Erysipelotrichales bacterium]